MITICVSLALCAGLLCIPAFATTVESSPTGNPDDITNFIVVDYPESNEFAVASAPEENTTTLTDSPTNGDGQIDNIIVLDLNIMPMSSYTDIEVPAHTAVYFTSKYFTSITMSVEYMPSNLTLHYGISNSSTGTGNHWANVATGGSGSATITPGNTRTYYLYVANGNDKVIYADVTYNAITAISMDDTV